MQKFKSVGQAQQFLSAHGVIYGHFRPRSHLVAASPSAALLIPILRSTDVNENGGVQAESKIG